MQKLDKIDQVVAVSSLIGLSGSVIGALLEDNLIASAIYTAVFVGEALYWDYIYKNTTDSERAR